MAYSDLQTFIKELENKGELVRVDTLVSSELEITEITDRISKKYGPAILFTNVLDSKYPVLMNSMGSYKRMSMGLGVESLDDIAKEIEAYLDLGNYFSVKRLLKNIPRFMRLFYALPFKTIGRGKCQEVIEKNVDLSSLPILKCWPEDAGKFLTLPLVFTKDRNTKQQNVGMYRMQVLDKNSTGMHWHKHKDGSSIYSEYFNKKERMPVSVALGCDTSITYSATAPLPKMLDEMMLAGWLRKNNVKMVKSITNDIYIPDSAEIVLEGYIDPTEDLVLEGPFGDHTGYYSLADYYPRFHVTCITHKKNAIYPATIVGKPPMEDCYMAKATERIFLPVLQLQIPEMIDLNLPLEGVFHNCAIISVKNKYPGVARKVMNAVWGMGQMMYTKLIIIVDETVDVQDTKQVLEAVLEHVEGQRDVIMNEGPLDALDHSSNVALYGTRVGMDATKKKDSAINYNPGLAHELIDNEKENHVTKTVHIISVKKEKAFEGMEAVKSYMNHHCDKIVIVVDQEVDRDDLSTVMWKVFNNIDGARDIVIKGSKIGIDATKKVSEEGITREWPNDIVMSKEMIDYVDKRWNEYGLN